MRLKIVAGNWKMNKTYGEALMLGTEVAYDAGKVHHQQLLTILAPPFPFISAVSRSVEGTDGIAVAAQNCHYEEAGAFTGEVSVTMIISTGARFVIIGHSERRMYFNETNDILLKKTRRALDHGLKPIFCIGETKEQRDAGKHFETIKSQLDQTLFQLTEFQILEIIIAYEPVWAIGTGVNASAQQAQEMHAFIRKTISDKFSPKLADSVSIIYGGSVNPANAAELFACKDVDGGLVGGSSLHAEDFSLIRKAMATHLA
ncbi:MAG TPA: triose-phosphate isomerase [Bacteroidia bacterium]|nr:triose-phosphate isomerase [Bacteroidia bacterium]